MRSLIKIFLCFFVFVNISLSASEQKPKLAVFDVVDKSKKYSRERLVAATEFIRGEIIATNMFIVIPKERQDRILIKEQKKESYKECYNEQCRIPLGQALSADTIVVSTMNLFDGVYTLRLEMIDLAKEATVNGTTVDFTDQKSFRDSARKAVAKLLGLEAAEEQKPQEKEKGTQEDSRYPGENFDSTKFSEPIVDDWVYFFQDKQGKYYYNQRTVVKESGIISVWYRVIQSKKIKKENNLAIGCNERVVYIGWKSGIYNQEVAIIPESYMDYLHSKVCN